MSRDQVVEAKKKGYCEFKNGAKLPFKQVNPQSWFVYYSPGTKSLQEIRKEGKEAGESLRTFTAIGQVLPGEPYSIDLGNDNIVFRRRARYVPNTTDAPLLPLMEKLSFLNNLPRQNPWGFAFRKGLVEVLKSDFYKLCEAMNIEMPKRHHLIFEQRNNANIKKPGAHMEVNPLIIDALKEPSTINSKIDAPIESIDESLQRSESSNGKINNNGIQPQEQEIDEIQQLDLHDTIEVSKQQEITKDYGDESSSDPIPDDNKENKKVAIDKHQQETCDEGKQNIAVVGESQQKEFQVPVNGQ